MTEKAGKHIDVDEIQPRLTVRQLAQYYGFTLPPRFGDSGEQRMRCPCQDCSGHEDDRSVSINTSDPYRRWKCHRRGYGCGASGNLLNLAYVMKHGRMPSGGKPTGREFYAIAEDLRRIDNGESQHSPLPDQPGTATRGQAADVLKQQPNVPLAESENAGARKLVELAGQLTVDQSQLNAAASAYARRRPSLLSEELAAECRFGYMAGSAKSSLRGQWVYGIMNETGQPLAWAGRNVNYEKALTRWERDQEGREPVKYRFPKQELFRRGLEFYGQEFINDPRFSQSLQQHGIILVEGFNGRVRMHELGVLSLGVMSNRLTPEQTVKISDLANQQSDNRVGLMFDLDAQGEEGAKEALWRLHQERVQAYLIWTRQDLQELVTSSEPETIKADEWKNLTTR